MKTSFNRYLLAFALGIGFFSWQACRERTVTKPDLIPPVDNINTFELSPDSLNISMQVGVFDSLRTNTFNANSSAVVALGQIHSDPFFGNIDAGLFIQFAPPTGDFTFPALSEYTFDSAVLSLPYTGFSYGDTAQIANNKQSVRVYRITQPMSIDDSIYVSKQYAYDHTPIGGGLYSLKDIKDTFSVAGDTLSGQLRIALNKNYIYNSIVSLDPSYFTVITNFLDYFKGWYIKLSNSSANANRLSYFMLSGANTHHTARIDFFFHDNDSNTVKVYSFPFRALGCGYANNIQREYQNSTAEPFLSNPNYQDSVLVQGYPGFYTEITFRNLNKIPPAVINQAQLVLTTIPVGMDGVYTPPQQLLLEQVTDNGKVRPIADVLGSGGGVSVGGLAFMDGSADKITINGQEYTQYKINFPRELQEAIMLGKDSLTLRIRGEVDYAGAFRMVAPGFNGSQDTKMKLNIIYTKIK